MNSDKQVKINGSSSLSYHAFVEKLVKKFPRYAEFVANGGTDADVQKAFDDMAYKLEILHAALGIVTEACEVADILKSHGVYDEDLDHPALIKELGDNRFWIQDIQNKFFISDHAIAQGNADKLSERYSKLVYTDTKAIARVDKKFVRAVDWEEVKKYAKGAEGTITFKRFEHIYEAAKDCSKFLHIFNVDTGEEFTDTGTYITTHTED